MIRLDAALLLALAAAPPRAPATKAAPRPSLPPSAPLPSLPVVTAIRLDVAREHVVVTQDVRLARGDDLTGDLRVHVAFGAPGAPRAFDAHLFPSEPDATGPLMGATGETLPSEKVPSRPSGVLPFLGPPQMSGAVVAIRAHVFERVSGLGGAVILRLRTLLDLPAVAPARGRDVLVRLGREGAEALTLGRVEVTSVASAMSPPPILSRVEAQLCGPGADPAPIAVRFVPPRAATHDDAFRLASPELVARRPTDALCLRLFDRSPADPTKGPSQNK